MPKEHVIALVVCVDGNPSTEEVQQEVMQQLVNTFGLSSTPWPNRKFHILWVGPHEDHPLPLDERVTRLEHELAHLKEENEQSQRETSHTSG